MACKSEFSCFALVKIFERDTNAVNKIFCTTRATITRTAGTPEEATAAAAEERGEEVVWVHAAHAAAVLQAGLTTSIVNVAFLRVGEYLITWGVQG